MGAGQGKARKLFRLEPIGQLLRGLWHRGAQTVWRHAMHGLINRAIERFVRDTYGRNIWLEVIEPLDLG